MATDILFTLGLSFLFIHEMDAIRCKEWRMFPGLSRLGDRPAEAIFILAHIPLIAAILYFIFQDTTSGLVATALSCFMVIHFVIHLLCLKHMQNEFKGFISWLIIFGAGGCGLAALLTNRW